MFIPVRDDNPTKTFPTVTVTLIVLNVLVFLFDRGFNPFGAPHLTNRFAAVPLEFYGTFLRAGALHPFWLSLFTAMFLHANIAHLLGNMWYLWLFGNNVEEAFGKLRYIALYLVWGVAAAALHTIVTPNLAMPMIGASGALAGVLGAYMILYPKAEIEGLWWVFFLFLPGTLPALYMLGFWFLLQFLAFQPGVAYWAHVGGFIAGMLTVWILGRRRLLLRHEQLHLSTG